MLDAALAAVVDLQQPRVRQPLDRAGGRVDVVVDEPDAGEDRVAGAQDAAVRVGRDDQAVRPAPHHPRLPPEEHPLPGRQRGQGDIPDRAHRRWNRPRFSYGSDCTDRTS